MLSILICNSPKMTLKEFVNLAPAEVLPDDEREIYEKLKTLRRDLLISDYAEMHFLTHKEGVLFVRKNLNSLASKILESQEDASIIDRIQAEKEVKNYFKDLWSKIYVSSAQ